VIVATALPAGAGVATGDMPGSMPSHSHRPLGLAMTPSSPVARRIGLRKGHFAQ
jgi:hypothetical protein